MNINIKIHVVEVIDKETDNVLYAQYFLTKKLAKKYINRYEKSWRRKGLKWAWAPDRLYLWGWQ